MSRTLVELYTSTIYIIHYWYEITGAEIQSII